MKSRMGKLALMTALAAAASGGVATVASSPSVTSQSTAQHQTATTSQIEKASKQIKATRLTSSRRAGYQWLKPTNKESFKQARRKQLKKRAKRKAK